MFEATLCGNPGLECQKLRVFGHFCMTESVLTTCFTTYSFFKPCRAMPQWFQRDLKPFLFSKKGSETVVWFVLNHKRLELDEIGPDDLFCYIWQTIPRRPVMVSEGFQGVWNRARFQGVSEETRGVSEGSETVRGFRGVSEGSESRPWFHRGFRRVCNFLFFEGPKIMSIWFFSCDCLVASMARSANCFGHVFKIQLYRSI